MPCLLSFLLLACGLNFVQPRRSLSAGWPPSEAPNWLAGSDNRLRRAFLGPVPQRRLGILGRPKRLSGHRVTAHSALPRPGEILT